MKGLTENKNAQLVAIALEQATGTAERDAAVGILYSLGGTITLGADTGSTKRRASSTAANSSAWLTQRLTQRKRKLMEEL